MVRHEIAWPGGQETRTLAQDGWFHELVGWQHEVRDVQRAVASKMALSAQLYRTILRHRPPSLKQLLSARLTLRAVI